LQKVCSGLGALALLEPDAAQFTTDPLVEPPQVALAPMPRAVQFCLRQPV
jgi:hypothetical protein